MILFVDLLRVVCLVNLSFFILGAVTLRIEAGCLAEKITGEIEAQKEDSFYGEAPAAVRPCMMAQFGLMMMATASS